MLTKKDLEQVEEIVQRNINNSIKSAFRDFYDTIFEPYANKNEREHAEMVKEIKAVKRDTEELKEHVKDHSKRLTHLEALTPAKN